MVCRSGLGGEQMTTEGGEKCCRRCATKGRLKRSVVRSIFCAMMRRRAELTDLFVALD
jgi:hypothetical protein